MPPKVIDRRGSRADAAPRDWRSDETVTHNVRMLYSEVLWAGISGGILGGFLSIFALRLGATAFEVSLLTTGPAVAGIMFPMLAAKVIRRWWGRLVFVVPLAAWRLVFLMLVLVAWATPAARVPILVAAYTLLSVPLVFFGTAFTPLLGKVLPKEIRAKVISLRTTLAGLTSTLAVLCAGKILDVVRFPLNFQIVFMVGLIASQISTFLIGRVRIPALNEREAPPGAAKRSSAEQPGVSPPTRLLTRAFWHFTAGATILVLGIYLPIALFPIVLVQKLHATNGWIGALGMVGGLVSVVLSPLWGRAAVRFGNRSVLVASSILYTVAPIGASMASNVVWYIPVSVAAGGCMAGINLGLFQCLLDVAPESRQTHYTAVYAVPVNAAAAISPMLGTWLLSTIGMAQTFELGAGCGLLGSVVLFAGGQGMRLHRSQAQVSAH